jgi:hypothetical protein
MYTLVLMLHSLVRWVVLITGLVAFVRGLAGWSGTKPWTSSDAKAGAWFARALDVQMLLGLILYFGLSPITWAALRDFGGAMGNAALRYWAVEHVFGMVVALTLAHIGVGRMKKTADERRRHRVAAIFFGLALVAILVSIPWPGFPQGRPLFRLTP